MTYHLGCTELKQQSIVNVKLIVYFYDYFNKVFCFRVGSNPPETLNSPNLDGDPVSSYTGDSRHHHLHHDHFYSPGHHSSHRDSHNPIQSRSGQILWIRGLTRLQTQVSVTSLTLVFSIYSWFSRIWPTRTIYQNIRLVYHSYGSLYKIWNIEQCWLKKWVLDVLLTKFQTSPPLFYFVQCLIAF